MLCYLIRRLIQAYLGDALRSGDADRLRRHCERCPSCASAMREAEGAARMVASLPRRSLADEDAAALLARVRTRGQERLGERLLGTPPPVSLLRKPPGVRAAEWWDALKHGAVVAGFRLLSRPAALPAFASVPVAALLLVALYHGMPTTEKVAKVSTAQIPLAVRNTAPSVPPTAGAPRPGPMSPLPGIAVNGELARPGGGLADSVPPGASTPPAPGAVGGPTPSQPAAKPARGRFTEPAPLLGAPATPAPADAVDVQARRAAPSGTASFGIRAPSPIRRAAGERAKGAGSRPEDVPAAAAARVVAPAPEKMRAVVMETAPSAGGAERAVPPARAVPMPPPAPATIPTAPVVATRAVPLEREAPAVGSAQTPELTAAARPAAVPGSARASTPPPAQPAKAVATVKLDANGKPGLPGGAAGGRFDATTTDGAAEQALGAPGPTPVAPKQAPPALQAGQGMGVGIEKRNEQRVSAGSPVRIAQSVRAQRKGKDDTRSVDELVRLLGGRPEEARAAAQELGRRREKRAVDALGRALNAHADAGVRGAAAGALAAIGTPEAAAILRAVAAGDGPGSDAARKAQRRK